MMKMMRLLLLFAFAMPLGAWADTVIVDDPFTAANSTSLSAHTPNTTDVLGIGNWTLGKVVSSSPAPAADIQSNKANITTTGGVFQRTATANLTIQVNWTPTAGLDNRVKLITRKTTDGNHV